MTNPLSVFFRILAKSGSVKLSPFCFSKFILSPLTLRSVIYFLFLKKIIIFIQLQFSAFSPLPSTLSHVIYFQLILFMVGVKELNFSANRYAIIQHGLLKRLTTLAYLGHILVKKQPILILLDFNSGCAFLIGSRFFSPPRARLQIITDLPLGVLSPKPPSQWQLQLLLATRFPWLMMASLTLYQFLEIFFYC